MPDFRPPIVHLDADCFYVSAERVRDAFLLGKPVGVLGNQGACVIAKSYEMKAAGVKTGEPIWEALVKCPDGIYIKRDFRWYEVLSRMMLEVVREFSPRVEYYSIDEFFCQATPVPGQDFRHYADALRLAIWDRVRVPVTLGIARTRTLAKLISDTGKPNGVAVVLEPAAEEEVLARLAVTEITGIAGRRAKRLAPWGIASCLDFARSDRRLVRQLLTAAGEALWWELNGDPVVPIHPVRPLHKVISRGGSFGEATDQPLVLFAWLVRNVERLVEELEYHQVLAAHVTVWVAYRDGRVGSGTARPEVPTDRFDILIDTLKPCLEQAWIPRGWANRMHLFADKLVPRSQAQRGLFEPDGERQARVAELKRTVNARHGRFALRSCATLALPEVYGDPANGYDICDVRDKSCF